MLHKIIIQRLCEIFLSVRVPVLWDELEATDKSAGAWSIG